MAYEALYLACMVLVYPIALLEPIIHNVLRANPVEVVQDHLFAVLFAIDIMIARLDRHHDGVDLVLMQEYVGGLVVLIAADWLVAAQREAGQWAHDVLAL